MEMIGVRRRGADNFRVLHHGKLESFCDGSQHGVVYGKSLRYGRKRERFQFHSGQIEACESAQCEINIVRQQERRSGSVAVDQKLGIEELEDRLCFRILVHQLEIRV